MKCLPGLLRNRPDSQGLPRLSGCEEDETSREPSRLVSYRLARFRFHKNQKKKNTFQDQKIVKIVKTVNYSISKE
jgi:hypothetical protein